MTEKIAIIGSGISALATAYLLAPRFDVTVFDRATYAGGHARTITVPTKDGDIAVDTGFIVLNNWNYPNLMGLFRILEVPLHHSRMSFGVSIDGGRLEYASGGLLAQRRNICRPAFWRMIIDILRFNAAGKGVLPPDHVTLGQYLDTLRTGPWFRGYYMQAMAASIWSLPAADILDFPARTLLTFFHNHGLLNVRCRPQWSTVVGGSRDYVRRLTAPFADRIVLGNGIQGVVRRLDGVEVIDDRHVTHRFDRVVIGTHAPEALAMLRDADQTERAILGAFRTQKNEVITHTDVRLMPCRLGAWASWVYLSSRDADHSSVSLTYWMNNLQPLQTTTPILVTLNPGMSPDPDLVLDRHTFYHPIFDRAAIAAQGRLAEIQGKNRTYFVGAWQRYGFHEDGILSAVRVAKLFGVTPPWV